MTSSLTPGWIMARSRSRRGMYRSRTLTSVVPSVATIHRILVRRGLVNAQPQKRPKWSWRRFEAPAPNEWWQIDAMDWLIVAGIVTVFNIIDDHSRVVSRSRAVPKRRASEAWTTFCASAHGGDCPPGCCRTTGCVSRGKLRGFEVFFEAHLRDAGVRPDHRACLPPPDHRQSRTIPTDPQEVAPPTALWPSILAELQAQLDEFCANYNHQRPHQGIGRVTPLERWQASRRSTPADSRSITPHPDRRTEDVVCNHRQVSASIDTSSTSDAVATEPPPPSSPTTLRHRLHQHQLIRHLKIDPTRRYQPQATIADPTNPSILNCHRCPAT